VAQGEKEEVRMNISYLSAAQIPSRAAQSIQVMRMAQAFTGIGHTVTLIVPGATETDDVYGFYGVTPSFAIKRVTRLKLKEIGLLLWGFQAAMVSRRCKPDLVYGRQVHGCFFAALFGLPVVLEIHEPPHTRLSRRLLRRLVSMPECKRVVTNSGALAKLLHDTCGVPSDKILAAPNGAEDPGGVRPFGAHNGDRLRIGYVGHLYPGRGIDLIFDIARACPWADFHLVGGREEDLSHWRAQLGGQSNVILHGYVPPAAAEQYRQDCDVLLAPYQRESLTMRRQNQTGYMSPLKLFEYMASGRAILCADLPVLHEIVSDGSTALLCDPDKSEVWIEALERLRDNPSLREKLGINARSDFLLHFTRTARANRILAGISIDSQDKG
jgi:glycosyltransferase involved in cell wall biosynthesis